MKKTALVWIVFNAVTLFAFDIQIPVHYDTLKNGLRLIIVPDTNVAIVSCRLYYFVGSMYEGPGSTGLSHMYEHMMFKGTKKLGTQNYKKEIPYIASIDSLEYIIQQLRARGHKDSDEQIVTKKKKILDLLDKQRQYIKKDEIWELYQNNGGTNLNAWTGDDLTAYIVTLPQNKFELFCWIESDRMQNPILREFDSERDVVMEERRMRYENRPLNKYWEVLSAHFFIAHPYRLPTIGWKSDISSFTRARLQEHVNRYYTPDNALIVLVGNVDPVHAKQLITKYFERIPRASRPKQEVVTREPEPIGETRFTLYEDAQPRIDMLFHTPGYPNDDLYVLDVIEGLLSGRSGRLYTRLVNKEKLCVDADAGNSYKLQNGYFHVWAAPKAGADPAKIEAIMLEELQNLQTILPTTREMGRIKNSIQMDFVTQLKSLEGLSDQLAWFERLSTWKDLISYPYKIDAVLADSIPAIAKRYLDPAYKTIGLLLPKPQPIDRNQRQEHK